ncbi:hypothetical protein BDZ91DRAFT_815850 [Kalaharituber pfeilii]|nr:hypothetical protein BDZ91DRAFT_815850 [Kalaharituber pfeilii]
MAGTLVLRPFAHLALDIENCSAHSSFLADRPPLSPISNEKLFKIPPTSDSQQDLQLLWPSGAIRSIPLSRRSSPASVSSCTTSSRAFLSLAASTRSIFGQNNNIITSETEIAFESQNVESEGPASWTGVSTLNSAFADGLSTSDNLVPEDELQLSDHIREERSGFLNDSIGCMSTQNTPLITYNEKTPTPLECYAEQRNSQLSFASGTLRYSKRSTVTIRSKSPSTLDEATISRMRKRRDLIEELLQSEEIYISELKTLLNVYFGSDNDDIYPFTAKKAMFIRTIGGVLDLHERLYQSMQHAIPLSVEARQASWGMEARISSLPSPFNTGNPAAAALVANAFADTMKDLLAYEDFISQYDAMLKEGVVFKLHTHRRSWERNCEFLVNSFLSKSQPESTKRALTFEDLLMKPIQRICKYPLFFTELLRVTPVIDCPESNAILDRINTRVKEIIYQLDMAKDNSPKLRERLERNWLLQKRLCFKDKLGPLPPQLGQVVLCGTLFAVWKDSKSVQGEYLACLLYKSYLLLATVSKSDLSLNVILVISLMNARIEDASQGSGIQCQNAPFTWIVAFEHDFRMYEIILCAWTAREEEVWRRSVGDRIALENRDWIFDGSPTQRTLFFRPIACNIEPSGSTGGYQRSLRRHWSFHGSVTPALKTEPIVVNIHHTWAPSEPALQQPRTRPTQGLSRSSSVVNISNVFSLSPKRSTRSRVENALADVWSKDQLPAGASNWLLGSRKFSMGSIPSMASITSTFGRKSSQVICEGQSPPRSSESETARSDVKTKTEKRRSNSLGPLERVKGEKHEPSSPKESPKEPKTPTSPVWQGWGSFKGKEPTATSRSPVLLGDKGTCKKKRWSSPANVMRLFECDIMFGSVAGDKKAEF